MTWWLIAWHSHKCGRSKDEKGEWVEDKDPCNVLWRVQGHGTLLSHRSYKSHLIREEKLSAGCVNMWRVLIRFVQAYGDLLSGLAWLRVTTKGGGMVSLVCRVSLATRLLWCALPSSDLRLVFGWIRLCERSFGFCKGHSFVPLDSEVSDFTLHSTSASQEKKRH